MSVLAVDIVSPFDTLQSLDSATDLDTFIEETMKAAGLADRTRPWKVRSSVSAKTLAIVDESCAARQAGHESRHRELVNTCTIQLQVDREWVQ